MLAAAGMVIGTRATTRIRVRVRDRGRGRGRGGATHLREAIGVGVVEQRLDASPCSPRQA